MKKKFNSKVNRPRTNYDFITENVFDDDWVLFGKSEEYRKKWLKKHPPPPNPPKK